MAVSTFLSPEILAYYQQGREAARLLTGGGRLEFARTQEIILRYLPPAPAVIYDIGGGPGLYACWLAKVGHEVHLLDVVALHIEQAQAASRLQPEHPIHSFTVGDARRLDRASDSVDVALLLGPLYHLQERQDRIAALQEARRVLKPGGVLLAAAISSCASALDGLRHEMLGDPDFVGIVKQDLQNGRHQNPRDHHNYFTTAYFHPPQELQREVEGAGFKDCQLLAVEGPGWLLPEFEERWQDPPRREMILMGVRLLEAEPSVIGVSCHLMAVGRK